MIMICQDDQMIIIGHLHPCKNHSREQLLIVEALHGVRRREELVRHLQFGEDHQGRKTFIMINFFLLISTFLSPLFLAAASVGEHWQLGQGGSLHRLHLC